MAGTWRPSPLACGLLWLVPGALLVTAPAARAWDEVINSVMYRSPQLPQPRVVKVFPKQKETQALWLEALRRPEADYRCQAALTIALAHQRGMKGLKTAVAPLLAVLDQRDQHPSVRLAAAQALIELDAREAAPRLFRQAESGNSDLRDLIEPALARWDYRPARAVWLKRLAHPDLSGNGLLLAVRGLGAVREEKAVPGLRELALSQRLPAPVRLEAARALGNMRASGSEQDARQLMADGSARGIVGRLAAASLLRHHQGNEAIQLLQRLAKDAEPAVAVVALARLVEIDAKLVLPALDQLLASPDAEVRLFAVEVLFRQPRPRPPLVKGGKGGMDPIRLLADRLDDRHPAVRVKARRALRELGTRAEYREPVIRQGMRVLAGTDWRGLEQAVILLAQLEHKPAAGRMVELLKSNRPEVLVAAAWGLRQLAVTDTLPAALDHLRLWYGQLAHSITPAGVSREALDQQLSQLAQLLGHSRYRPAEAVFRQMIPRPGDASGRPALIAGETRAAAIWALGLIHEGKPVAELAEAFQARLSDGGGFMRPAEDDHVRWMSAISLGRMKAEEALGTLRRFYPDKKLSLDPVHNACGWSIQQITGEIMPQVGTVEVPAAPFSNWLRDNRQ